jgi:hypothetical protein
MQLVAAPSDFSDTIGTMPEGLKFVRRLKDR